MPSDTEFENLVTLYYRDLYRFGFSLTRNEADAADLAQQTFYIWATKGLQLRDASTVKSWLFTALHREFLQGRRRQSRFSDEGGTDIGDEIPAADHNVIDQMDAQTMLQFLAELDEAFQAPLVLYFMEDLSYKEIATILEIPLGTVQSRIARGKAHLYQLMTNAPAPAQGGSQ